MLISFIYFRGGKNHCKVFLKPAVVFDLFLLRFILYFLDFLSQMHQLFKIELLEYTSGEKKGKKIPCKHFFSILYEKKRKTYFSEFSLCFIETTRFLYKIFCHFADLLNFFSPCHFIRDLLSRICKIQIDDSRSL